MASLIPPSLLEKLRFGLPVIQYRDGQVVEVLAEELAPYARRILKANGEPLPEEIAADLKAGATGRDFSGHPKSE